MFLVSPLPFGKEDIQRYINNGQITTGMTKDEVLASWGEPNDIRRDFSKLAGRKVPRDGRERCAKVAFCAQRLCQRSGVFRKPKALQDTMGLGVEAGEHGHVRGQGPWPIRDRVLKHHRLLGEAVKTGGCFPRKP